MKIIYRVYYQHNIEETKDFDSLSSAIIFAIDNLREFMYINMIVQGDNTDSTFIFRKILTKKDVIKISNVLNYTNSIQNFLKES